MSVVKTIDLQLQKLQKEQSQTRYYVCFIGNMAIDDMEMLLTKMKMNPEKLSLYVLNKMRSAKKIEELTAKFKCNVKYLSDFSEETMIPIFTNAIIGTKLILIGEWRLVKNWKHLAIAAGFTEEEIIIEGFGEKEEQVFCVKCYQLNRKTEAKIIQCRHCGQTLEVSNHYSKRLDAYLGYIGDSPPSL